MKPAKFIVSSTALGTAIILAVSTLSAQETRRPDPPRTGEMVFDGMGPAIAFGGGRQLGVTVSDPKATESKDGGVRIDSVTDASPAAKAGLKAGDLVVEYDGERVRSSRQLTRLVQETPEGRPVRIAVLRNGQRQTVEATPEARDTPWYGEIDGDRIRREVERGMQGARDFRLEPPGMRTSRGRLGVSVESMTPQLAAYFGARDGGVLVSSVADDSAAKKAGLKAGDVILTVNGARVTDPQALVQELSNAGGEITLGVMRDRKETTVRATLSPAGVSPLW
jgi:serine protease Do